MAELESNTVGVERRNSARFPIAEEVRYRLLDRYGEDGDGSGTTVDMGRHGLLFTTSAPPAAGRLVEISVNWPVALDGVCPLKLVAVGRVVRSAGTRAAVTIQKYEFKTRRRSSAQ